MRCRYQDAKRRSEVLRVSLATCPADKKNEQKIMIRRTDPAFVMNLELGWGGE